MRAADAKVGRLNTLSKVSTGVGVTAWGLVTAYGASLVGRAWATAEGGILTGWEAGVSWFLGFFIGAILVGPLAALPFGALVAGVGAVLEHRENVWKRRKAATKEALTASPAGAELCAAAAAVETARMDRGDKAELRMLLNTAHELAVANASDDGTLDAATSRQVREAVDTARKVVANAEQDDQVTVETPARIRDDVTASYLSTDIARVRARHGLPNYVEPLPAAPKASPQVRRRPATTSGAAARRREDEEQRRRRRAEQDAADARLIQQMLAPQSFDTF